MDFDMEYSVKDIIELMEAQKRNKIAGLRIKSGDFELELQGVGVIQPVAVMTEEAHTATAVPEYDGKVVTSPIVGTFYASPAPDREPFVAIGDKVKKGDVLFIIESMKLMNEVTSEISGTVTEILVSNAQGVEYGQPILCIKENAD